MAVIEFLPWYVPDTQFSRCDTCGAVVLTADQETHVKWHEQHPVIAVKSVHPDLARQLAEVNAASVTRAIERRNG